MGEVRSFHDTVIGRDVAMKVIRAEHRTRQDIVGRFLREARVQGQLEHPAIVPVYEVGVTPEGAAYFTMKRLRGTSLTDALAASSEGEGFTRRRLLSAFSSVCLAVDFAHSRGVIHRDLKPDNIMLGDFGEVYVLDWGVAKIKSSAESEPITRTPSDDQLDTTRPGSLLGTLGYMSPEQVRGAVDELDRRSDVYSLGVILFEILAGEKLHKGKTHAELIFSTMNPTGRSPAERAPEREVPVELDQAVLRATEQARDDRTPTARALSEAIERYLDGDRDVERRTVAAKTHADAALGHLMSAVSHDATPEAEQRERASAMREVGAALGLDPHNTAAKGVLVQLLETPMKELPREARASLEEALLDLQQKTSQWGAAAFGCFFLVLPLLLWMGVREPAIVLALFAAMALGSAGYLRAWLRRRARATMPGTVLFASFVGLVLVSGVLGPLWVPPLLATVNAIGLVLTSKKERRPLLLALSVLTVTLPLLLQRLRIMPASYEFVGGDIIVKPWLVSFPPLATQVAVTVFGVSVVASTVVVVGKFRDLLTDAEERQVTLAWQLQQMVR